MRKIIHSFLLLLAFTITTPVMAALNIFACEPEWASLATELGGERVKTFSATTAYQDPHHIEARPSLIAKVRRADLLICSGAELEVGWLPLLHRQAGNSKVLPGARGYFEAAAMVKPLDIPTGDIDRTMGDVHAAGNPHVHLDPARLLKIARALSERLAEIDPAGKAEYQQRLNHFTGRWQKAMTRWQQQASALKGSRIVVHHRDWVYLFDWLGIEIAGALEPKPGLPTTAGHLVSLKQSLKSNPATMIVYTAYQNPRAAKRFAQMAGIPAVELPYTVGGAKEVNDLFSLFDVTIEKLTGKQK
jgi:zinc/manganese transport system substrate-binding protein